MLVTQPCSVNIQTPELLLSRFYGDHKEFNFMGIDAKLTWVPTQLSLSLALLDFGT